MNLTELLNSDMTTIARTLRAGFDWWRGEMQDMLPAGLVGQRRRLDAFHRIGPDGEIMAATTRGVDTLVLSSDMCLVRHLQLPRMSDADLHNLVTLDADRIMPVTPDQIVMGLRNAGPGTTAGTVSVVVGAIPLARAVAIAEALGRAGIAPAHIGPLDADGQRLDFDLAAGMRKAGLLPQRLPVARFWWAAVAVLTLVNIGVAILRDQQQVRQLEELVDTQSPALTTVRKIEDRLRGNAATVRSLDDRRKAQQPLQLLAALGAALPEKAWIERLEWDGRQIRLSGYAADGVNVVSALKASPAFKAVRASRSEAMAETNAGKPFDLTATTGTGTDPAKTPMAAPVVTAPLATGTEAAR